MIVIQSYSVAVMMCIVTMLCWGSWANTQKLASKQWKFQLFYWDYSIGVLLLSLVIAFTMGSFGDSGRSFMADVAQESAQYWKEKIEELKSCCWNFLSTTLMLFKTFRLSVLEELEQAMSLERLSFYVMGENCM